MQHFTGIDYIIVIHLLLVNGNNQCQEARLVCFIDFHQMLLRVFWYLKRRFPMFNVTAYNVSSGYCSDIVQTEKESIAMPRIEILTFLFDNVQTSE